MKTATISILLFLCILFILGCEKNPAKSRVDEYADTMVSTYKGTKEKGKHVNIQSMQNAIQMYHAIHNRYPATIEDVAALMDKPIDTSSYEYNPGTGEIRLKK
jgi:PBP1b-binding outer membrane lipoprotein LpoB